MERADEEWMALGLSGGVGRRLHQLCHLFAETTTRFARGHLSVCFDGRLVVHLALGVIPDSTDHLVTAGDDLVRFGEPLRDLNIGGPGDTRFNLAENSLATGDHKD